MVVELRAVVSINFVLRIHEYLSLFRVIVGLNTDRSHDATVYGTVPFQAERLASASAG